MFPQVKNLRSAVARGAIACMGDLFASMRSSMEKVCLLSITTGSIVARVMRGKTKCFITKKCLKFLL